MRKFTFCFLLFFPIYLLGQKTRVFNIKFSEQDFSFIKDGDFLNIVSKDGKTVIWGDTLDLALPYVGVNILIDSMDDYGGLTYDGHEVLVESNILVDYNSAPIPTNIHQEVIRSYRKEYTKKSYPEKNVQFTGMHTMDGYNYLSFVVCPFRYDVDNKKLYLLKDLSLYLDLKSKSAPSNVSQKNQSVSLGKNMHDIVKDLTINGNELDIMYHTDSNITRSISMINYNYIIVTNEVLRPAFEKLAHWKTIKGKRAKVITVEDCCDAYPDMDPQLAIKTVLYNYYYNNSMEYVLLGGDTNIVPARLCYLPHVNNTTDTPADLFYACFDNNFAWDANGNQIYGELTDNVDLSPEFILTRVSVSTLAEAEIFAHRIIEYECSPKVDGWTNSMLSCGSKLLTTTIKNNVVISDSQYQGEYVYENGVQPYWNGTLFELFDTYSDHPDGANYDATGDNIQIELAKGYTFVDEFSHGWVDVWRSLENGTVYNLGKAESLVNNSYTVITTTACHTNAFDKISTDYPNQTAYYTTCLSESFIRNPNSGILAYLGSSREGWIYYSYLFDNKFYEYLLSGNDKQFGRAAMLAKNAFLADISTTTFNTYQRIIMSLNPMGDPEMSIFTQNPQSFDNVSVSFSNGSLNVSTGVSNCNICISSAADFGDGYYKTYNNVNGVNLSGINTDCYLCISKQGYIPYIARVGNSVFLQNENILRNLSVFSTNTYVGSNINNSITQGSVSIQKGKFTNKSLNEITIQNDFEVKTGAELEILLP